MKKIAAVAVCFLLCLTSQAQGVQFGIRGGVNASSESPHVYPAATLGTKYTRGFNLGGVVDIPLADRWALEADILYSRQGYRDDIYLSIFDITSTSYHAMSHYVNVPVTAKFYLTDHLYLECGPQAGVLLSKHDNADELGFEDAFRSNETKPFDVGIVGGIGCWIADHAFVSGRYTQGLTDSSTLYKGGKNRVFQLSLAYMF